MKTPSLVPIIDGEPPARRGSASLHQDQHLIGPSTTSKTANNSPINHLAMKTVTQSILGTLLVLAFICSVRGENLPGVPDGDFITLEAQGVNPDDPRFGSGFTYDIPTDFWPPYLAVDMYGADGGKVTIGPSFAFGGGEPM